VRRRFPSVDSQAGNGSVGGTVFVDLREFDPCTVEAIDRMEPTVSGRILVVDDDQDTLSAYALALGPLQASIVTASSGEEALNLVADQDFAAIVLDVSMDGMNGFEAAARIRKLEESRCTPILFVTGNSFNEPQRRRGYEIGGVDYLSKPVDLDVLQAKLRVFLQLDQALREILRLNEVLKGKVVELADALAHVKTLRGLIPICSYCRKIRDDKQSWQVLEAYIMQHTDTTFSHGICPACYETYVRVELEQLKAHAPPPQEPG
jgi:CheY-like chemotaxis protein